MRNILIVVDMQNDFIDGSLGTKEAQEIVTPVVGKIRNFEGGVLNKSAISCMMVKVEIQQDKRKIEMSFRRRQL